MAMALHALPLQPRPSHVVVPGLLDGLDVIRERFTVILGGRSGLSHAAE
jgi:hypothetical protein